MKGTREYVKQRKGILCPWIARIVCSFMFVLLNTDYKLDSVP